MKEAMTKPEEPDTELPCKVRLVVGDWSDDGHGKTESFSVASNQEQADVAKAYEKGAKRIKLQLTRDVAAGYDEHHLTRVEWGKLTTAGLTLNEVFEDDQYDIDRAEACLKKGVTSAAEAKIEGIMLNPRAFAVIWLFIARMGDTSLRYRIEEDDRSSITIGGYGLFE